MKPQPSSRPSRFAALRAARGGVFLLAAALWLSLTAAAAQRPADAPRTTKTVQAAKKKALPAKQSRAVLKSVPKHAAAKKKTVVSQKKIAAAKTRAAKAPKKPPKKSAARASRILPPAVVDSFRTIILTSCKEAPEPWEVTMREEMTRWLSVRYRRAGISMSGVDCSGFIRTIFRTTVSVDLPHSAAQQASMGAPVDTGDLRFGDLIFFRAKKRINHVGIYIGEGRFVHSSRTFGVRVDPLFESRYYARRFASARRMLGFADSGDPAQE